MYINTGETSKHNTVKRSASYNRGCRDSEGEREIWQAMPFRGSVQL